jgi:hypothetical protein
VPGELTGWKELHCLTTLAAAYSEKADFENAVKWQQKAIDLLVAKSPEISECRKTLERYKSKKPKHPVGLLEGKGSVNPLPRLAFAKGGG